MFIEKKQALKQKKEIQAHSSPLESAVVEACKTVPELHILDDAQLEAKIRKLATDVREAKEKVRRVTFEFNLKIAKLQLKLQPTTPLEVQEQHRVEIKEGMATLDATVTDCVALFEQSMELVTNLQEDLNLQTLSTEIRELQCQYDEVRVTAHSLAEAQFLAMLQEGKQLLAQVEDVQNKEALLKVRLHPWLEESYQVITSIHDNLKGLKQTQQIMRLVVQGPTTKKMIEEVQQAAAQSTAEVVVIQVQYGGIPIKITAPTE